MMQDSKLPILGRHFQQQESEQAEGSCSPKAYVTNEEAAVVAAIRKLRDRAVGIRATIEQTEDPAVRRELEQTLSELREQRKELVVHREAAWRRKMIMLGHLPPDGEEW